jgi:hypothetical protein
MTGPRSSDHGWLQKGYCGVLDGTEVLELGQFHSVRPVGGATLNGAVGKEIEGGVETPIDLHASGSATSDDAPHCASASPP